MKLFVILSALLFASISFAQDRVIEIDGQTYLCKPISGGGGGDSVSCANKAYSGPFSKSESMELCRGATSTAPADCALKMYSGPFSKSESLQLCTGAITTGPADCATLAYSGPFSKSESMELCAGALSDRTARCALDAYSGPYSKRESIDMCKARPYYEEVFSGLAHTINSENLSKDELSELVIKANLKAFKLGEYKN